MLIAVDIGNTNITIGFLENKQVINSYRLTTKNTRTSDEFGYILKSFIDNSKFNLNDIDDVIIGSVVPKIMHSFVSSIIKYLKVEPKIISSTTHTGITIKIDNPQALGTDRLVNAVAAKELYKTNCLVIDFGTATTFDVVTKNNEFIGGVTAPGLRISAEALTNQTAKLPEVEIAKPTNIIGKNTTESMQAGIFYGYVGLTEKIISEIKKEYGNDLKVISTGGLGRLIAKETNLIDEYNPNLIFVGLETIYHKNK